MFSGLEYVPGKSSSPCYVIDTPPRGSLGSLHLNLDRALTTVGMT